MAPKADRLRNISAQRDPNVSQTLWSPVSSVPMSTRMHSNHPGKTSMTRSIALVPLAALLAFAQPAAAAPPSNAKPLSEIVAALERGGDVAYFDEIEWDDDGYWEVEYYRRDGSKVEVKIDPVTGQSRR